MPLTKVRLVTTPPITTTLAMQSRGRSKPPPTDQSLSSCAPINIDPRVKQDEVREDLKKNRNRRENSVSGQARSYCIISCYPPSPPRIIHFMITFALHFTEHCRSQEMGLAIECRLRLKVATSGLVMTPVSRNIGP